MEQLATLLEVESRQIRRPAEGAGRQNSRTAVRNHGFVGGSESVPPPVATKESARFGVVRSRRVMFPAESVVFREVPKGTQQ